MAGHACVMCGTDGVAWRNPLCGPCRKCAPKTRLAVPLERAWRRRVFEPDAYSEALAGALLWYRDQRADRAA